MSTEQSFQPSVSHEEIKRRAMETFFFDNDDLSLNREGRLSDKQKQHLIKSAKKGVIILIAFGVVLSAFPLFPSGKPTLHLPWTFALVGMVVFIALGIFIYSWQTKAYKPGTVTSVVGTATFKVERGVTSLQIDDELFSSRDTFNKIFLPDVKYRVYYAPLDNNIVSIEILE